jgi:golgi-specific brefeldin A-resistance guanine nucleotide exchange factor 1
MLPNHYIISSNQLVE